MAHFTRTHPRFFTPFGQIPEIIPFTRRSFSAKKGTWFGSA